jgi:CheY-like chemotaxis protein
MIDSMPSSPGEKLYSTVVIKDQRRFWKEILIVDDDEDVTITFKAAIEDSNNDTNQRIEVYTANDPVVALSEFKPNFYDLLLADINMSHMNGFELVRFVCQRLVYILSTSQLRPVVFLLVSTITICQVGHYTHAVNRLKQRASNRCYRYSKNSSCVAWVWMIIDFRVQGLSGLSWLGTVTRLPSGCFNWK